MLLSGQRNIDMMARGHRAHSVAELMASLRLNMHYRCNGHTQAEYNAMARHAIRHMTVRADGGKEPFGGATSGGKLVVYAGVGRMDFMAFEKQKRLALTVNARSGDAGSPFTNAMTNAVVIMTTRDRLSAGGLELAVQEAICTLTTSDGAGAFAAENIMWEINGHSGDIWWASDNDPATMAQGQDAYGVFIAYFEIPPHLRHKPLPRGWWRQNGN